MEFEEEKDFYNALESLILGNINEVSKQAIDYQYSEEEIYDKMKGVILSKLKYKKSYELLLKNFNILSKEELSEFGIIKNYSNRDSYFYFLEYLINVNIIEENKINDKKNENKLNKVKKHTLPIVPFESEDETKKPYYNKKENFIYIRDDEEISKQKDFYINTQKKNENYIFIDNIHIDNSDNEDITKNVIANKENFIDIDINKDKNLSKKEKRKEYRLLIDVTGDKINVIKNPKHKIENFIPLIYNNNEVEENYKKMIIKKNIDIKKLFPIKEKISLENLREKINMFLTELTSNDGPKFFFTKFESELYFYNQLENILETIKESKDNNQFNKKINLIKNLSDCVDAVKNHKIKDKIILLYFYLVIDIEYKLSKYKINKINNFVKNKQKYKNAKVDEINNKLIITKDKIIDYFDCYELKESDIKKIKNGKLTLPLTEMYFSLKGLILFRELSVNVGNNFYDKFIGSNLLSNIFDLLYGKKYSSLNFILLREIFKNNTYYFKIKNSEYAAYCDKRNFKIFIDYSIDEEKLEELNLNTKIIHFIQKSFIYVNSEHEFGHAHHVVLSNIEINNNNYIYDSPLIKIKLKYDKEIQTKEGGKLMEYLLYGKIIYKLNLKQVIYICNLNNFSKSLKQFRTDFINLKNESINDVFIRESQNNNEILEIYELYKDLPTKIKDKLEKMHFKQAKFLNHNIKYFDFENITFSMNKSRKKDKKRCNTSESDTDEESENDCEVKSESDMERESDSGKESDKESENESMEDNECENNDE